MLALSHSKDSDFTLIAHKNYCNLFRCWTAELNANGQPVGASAQTPPSLGTEADAEEVAKLERLDTRASAVSKAATTLQEMLDPRTTSIILKAQNDLAQQLALGQLKRLKGSGTAVALRQAGKREARPVTILAQHLVNMERGLLSQEQQLLRDEQGLPYETRASEAQPRTSQHRDLTLRDALAPSPSALRAAAALPPTLRDASSRAVAALLRSQSAANAAANTAMASLSSRFAGDRQPEEAATSVETGEEDANAATEAVAKEVAEATQEADASTAQAVNELNPKT